MGRPRKVVDAIDEAMEPEAEIGSEPQAITTEKYVKTPRGEGKLTLEHFDMSTLSNLKPFREGEPLPPAQKSIVTDKRNNVTERLITPGEPRFFFRGDELIKVYMHKSKKTVLFWKYKRGKKFHDQIRARLIKQGIPQLG